MKHRLISKAISGIDLALVAEALSVPEKVGRAPKRTNKMNPHERKHYFNGRQLMRVALAACLIFALGLTVYACYVFGIRDLFKELPETAEPFIQEHTEAVAAEDWSARITESLCDETRVLVTVTVSGGDKYIIAPTDADPDTLASNIGIPGDMTLGEYARKQGKQLLFVGAALQQNDSLGGIGSQAFRNTSDSEMTILVNTEKKSLLQENEIICHVYAVDEQWEKQTLDIPFRLTEAPSEGSSTYVPDKPDGIPGMTVSEATVTETPLGISIRYMETITDEEAFYNIKKVEFNGLDYGKGGTVLEDDGNWWFTVSRCSGTVGDTLTARYYDWDDELVGTIVFELK